MLVIVSKVDQELRCCTTSPRIVSGYNTSEQLLLELLVLLLYLSEILSHRLWPVDGYNKVK